MNHRNIKNTKTCFLDSQIIVVGDFIYTKE
jgi:hypothetical protein